MKIIYLFILVLLAVSCKSPKNELYTFDPNNIGENEISLSEIADDISYIPLDNSLPIGLVYKQQIKFINNSIYLSAQNTGVLEFNKEGKLLKKIGGFGRGPGEYIYCYSFTVDEKTQSVYIKDSRIIKVFSKSGVFLRSFSLQESGDQTDAIEAFDSKLFTSCSIQDENANYEWIVFDTLGTVIKKKERTTPKFVSNALGEGGIYKFDNSLSYWNNYTDTVFSILPDLKQKPSFIISPGEQRLPKSRITVETMSDYMWFEQILETNQFITIRYFFPLKKFPFVLVDKKNNKSYLINLKSDDGGKTLIGGIKNDIDGGVSFLPLSYFIENGREFMVGLIYPYQIQTLVKSTEFKNSSPRYSEKKNDLIKLAGSIKETDNPVLMMIRLKK